MTYNTLSRRAFMAGGAGALALPSAHPGLAQQRQAEGGIGGTGIVGVLTDFGSLIVAGRYLSADADTVYSSGFGPLGRGALAIGNSLTVEASGPPDRLLARRVHLTHPLVGPVGAIVEDGRGLRVNGTEVRLERTVPGVGVGDRVAVSGVWRGRAVVAAMLSPAPSALDLVSGTVSRRPGRVRVGPVHLAGRGLAGLPSGSFVTVLGRFNPETGRLIVQRATRDRFTGAAGALRRLAVEGYLEPSGQRPGFRISGLGHSFAPGLRLAPFDGQRVLFEGAYTGLFHADRATALPETTADRRAALRARAR